MTNSEKKFPVEEDPEELLVLKADVISIIEIIQLLIANKVLLGKQGNEVSSGIEELQNRLPALKALEKTNKVNAFHDAFDQFIKICNSFIAQLNPAQHRKTQGENKNSYGELDLRELDEKKVNEIISAMKEKKLISQSNKTPEEKERERVGEIFVKLSQILHIIYAEIKPTVQYGSLDETEQLLAADIIDDNRAYSDIKKIFNIFDKDYLIPLHQFLLDRMKNKDFHNDSRYQIALALREKLVAVFDEVDAQKSLGKKLDALNFDKIYEAFQDAINQLMRVKKPQEFVNKTDNKVESKSLDPSAERKKESNLSRSAKSYISKMFTGVSLTNILLKWQQKDAERFEFIQFKMQSYNKIKRL